MKTLFLSILSFFLVASIAAESIVLKSPDGKISVNVKIEDKIRFSVNHEQTEVMAPSAISMTLANGTIWGQKAKLTGKKTKSINQTIHSSLYKKNAINDSYNELTLNFKGNYSIIFRAFDQGVAYRFSSSNKDSITVTNEEVNLQFGKDYSTIVPYVRSDNPKTFEQQFFNSFENTYTHANLSQLDTNRLMFLPLVVELNDGKKLCITESDLESYPGLYLHKANGLALRGVFAPHPKKIKQGGHNMLQGIVTERENFIAKCKGARNFPWRVFAISSSDKELMNNDLVYQLATPSRIEDTSWIKPGKVAWEWWNDWNVYGVDFKSGINNTTYKYYIDFASKHGIEYIILDEGWAVNLKADLLQVVPEIDIKELVDYGKARNVGIILWAGYLAVERDMENVFKTYSDMGVKGFKVDFMDRDDQAMVDFYYRCAETAAKYHLMTDFHGAYKPTGLNRTYPNVINFEGVHGLEQLKWSPASVDMVKYDVTIPFIRMLAGPMDYTQGAMRNASKENYRPINSEPMSQGTRCHQLAEYVIFESPLNMLCDSPSNYDREPECTDFISNIPTVWDETRALDGKISQYSVIARRKNDVWYVGGLTNWDKRDLTVDLSFLGEGSYEIELFRDGINADRAARDFKREIFQVPDNRQLSVTLMPGGGFAAKIIKSNGLPLR
jgi:alpha-glucosidase